MRKRLYAGDVAPQAAIRPCHRSPPICSNLKGLFGGCEPFVGHDAASPDALGTGYSVQSGAARTVHTARTGAPPGGDCSWSINNEADINSDVQVDAGTYTLRPSEHNAGACTGSTCDRYGDISRPLGAIGHPWPCRVRWCKANGARNWTVPIAHRWGIHNRRDNERNFSDGLPPAGDNNISTNFLRCFTSYSIHRPEQRRGIRHRVHCRSSSSFDPVAKAH